MGANMLAGVTGLLIVAGVTQAAHAEFTFRNDTGERVVFNLQCRNAGYEALSIDAWIVLPMVLEAAEASAPTPRLTIPPLMDASPVPA